MDDGTNIVTPLGKSPLRAAKCDSDEVVSVLVEQVPMAKAKSAMAPFCGIAHSNLLRVHGGRVPCLDDHLGPHGYAAIKSSAGR